MCWSYVGDKYHTSMCWFIWCQEDKIHEHRSTIMQTKLVCPESVMIKDHRRTYGAKRKSHVRKTFINDSKNTIKVKKPALYSSVRWLRN